MSDKNEFNFNLDPIPNSTKELLFNPTAEAIGKGVGGVASVFSILGRMAGIWSEDLIKNFESKILEKNQAIPKENRDFSKFQQTIKAIDDAVYSLAEEDLQEYFSNLISATLDNRKNKDIHPSFSSILKDFSSDDAIIFRKIYGEETVPVAGIRIHDTDKRRYSDLERKIVLFKDKPYSIPNELNSLVRSGLIEINESKGLGNIKYSERYKQFKKHDLYTTAQKNIKKFNELAEHKEYDMFIDDISLVEGRLQLTAVGKLIGSVIIADTSTS